VTIEEGGGERQRSGSERSKGLEAEYWAGDAFDGAVVLLDDVVGVVSANRRKVPASASHLQQGV
jgi:hypothetical protein